MMQSRLQSFLESFCNTLSGFILSIITGELVFPYLGWPVSHTQNFLAVCIFTVVSIVRTYIWRRVFNALHGVKNARSPGSL